MTNKIRTREIQTGASAWAAPLFAFGFRVPFGIRHLDFVI